MFIGTTRVYNYISLYPSRVEYRFSKWEMLFSETKNVNFILKGVFAKNKRGYRLNAIKKRF